ncbi:hypothetical protein M758_UG251200 [Ceratodon purpureus]|nr:hypothetical protein M758_UG251200 [Ceratodon purpureus]
MALFPRFEQLESGLKLSLRKQVFQLVRLCFESTGVYTRGFSILSSLTIVPAEQFFSKPPKLRHLKTICYPKFKCKISPS